jgi:multisubunit Na+/H+ antiporter MnhG subunit
MKASEESRPPAGERGPSRRSFLIAFTLFASYCLGANVAIALHEFGHALGCWLAGGKVLGLVLAPQGYSGSSAARDLSADFATSHGYFLLVAGGPVFGAAFGAVFALAARLLRRGTVGWIVTHGTGTWCIGNNGAYLFLGSLYPFGDALFLTELGVPRWGLFLVGLALVVVFLALFASFLRGIGLGREDSYRRWVLTVEAGLLGYLALILGWRLLRPPGGQLPATANDLLGLACSPVALLLLATCTYPFRRAARCESSMSEPRWTKAGMVLALGLLFMATEVLFFSYDYEAAAAAQSVRREEVGGQVR